MQEYHIFWPPKFCFGDGEEGSEETAGRLSSHLPSDVFLDSIPFGKQGAWSSSSLCHRAGAGASAFARVLFLPRVWVVAVFFTQASVIRMPWGWHVWTARRAIGPRAKMTRASLVPLQQRGREAERGRKSEGTSSRSNSSSSSSWRRAAAAFAVAYLPAPVDEHVHDFIAVVVAVAAAAGRK